ncbi:hypothetical protein ACFYZB_00870 [Streptomyces sp. NPDC001852]|uniref:hypothetical protein n=1 Tax=Streptomyces sp. NPDC001852 TaxID=3364619 RepID=UPI00367A0B81
MAGRVDESAGDVHGEAQGNAAAVHSMLSAASGLAGTLPAEIRWPAPVRGR